MKYFIYSLLFLIVFSPEIILGQDKRVQSFDEETIEEEDFNTTKVMVIPFNPSFYKRNVEEIKELGLKKQKEQEVKAWFSFGLNENISPRIITINHEEKKMLNDYAADSEADLAALYTAIEYQEEKRDRNFLKKNASLIDNLLGKIRTSGDKSEIEIDRSYESDKKHKTYLNCQINDPAILPHLSEKYGVKLFVFINKFEIFTNYKKSIDAENKIFQREIKISFSVYSGKGDQLFGDLALVTFYPTITKNIDQLIMQRFPIVRDYLSAVMPDATSE